MLKDLNMKHHILVTGKFGDILCFYSYCVSLLKRNITYDDDRNIIKWRRAFWGVYKKFPG